MISTTKINEILEGLNATKAYKTLTPLYSRKVKKKSLVEHLNIHNLYTMKANMYVLAQNENLDDFTRMVCYQMGYYIDVNLLHYAYGKELKELMEIPNGVDIFVKYAQPKHYMARNFMYLTDKELSKIGKKVNILKG